MIAILTTVILAFYLPLLFIALIAHLMAVKRNLIGTSKLFITALVMASIPTLWIIISFTNTEGSSGYGLAVSLSRIVMSSAPPLLFLYLFIAMGMFSTLKSVPVEENQ